jgi:hypothetical protein
MSEKQRPDPSHTRRHVPLDSRPPAERIPSLARPEEAPTQVTRRPDLPPDLDLKGKKSAPRPERSSRPPRPPQPDQDRSGLVVPWWGFVIVILAVAAITCGMWYVVLSNKGVASTGLSSPTPIFVVITNTPTLGASAPEEALEESPTATLEVSETTPTEETPPTEEPSDGNPGTPIQIGDKIVINGTEGSGLAVRQGPGLEYTYFFVANDGEAYTVEDGPRVMDDYIWWYIVDPEDEDRSGWAVEDFMEVTGS